MYVHWLFSLYYFEVIRCLQWSHAGHISEKRERFNLVKFDGTCIKTVLLEMQYSYEQSYYCLQAVRQKCEVMSMFFLLSFLSMEMLRDSLRGSLPEALRIKPSAIHSQGLQIEVSRHAAFVIKVGAESMQERPKSAAFPSGLGNRIIFVHTGKSALHGGGEK